MQDEFLTSFLNQHVYDVRVTHNGRWIDQKCCPDTLNFVADCVVHFVAATPSKTFISPDVWRSEYASTNVQDIFGKPDPSKFSAHDEFNKFFRQPLKLLAAAHVLGEDDAVPIDFSVLDQQVLEFISLTPLNAYRFLSLYIEKTLRDSGLWFAFQQFFEDQSKESFAALKKTFCRFSIDWTPIKTEVEASRIFSKVLNTLAFKLHTKGTIKGHISNTNITWADLIYNRANWRDSEKNKDVPRQDFVHVVYKSGDTYQVSQAKKAVRDLNDNYFGGQSEAPDNISFSAVATNAHHIFPASQFPELSDYPENIIMLTAGQHQQHAHPNGNTSVVDPKFQYYYLQRKIQSIQTNLSSGTQPHIYDFSKLVYVLNTGYHTEIFSTAIDGDFDGLLTLLKAFSPSGL